MVSLLDSGQIVKRSYSDADEAIKVKQIAGSLVTETYNELVLTYVASGNGVGEVETVTFKNDGVTVALLTLEYDGDNNLSRVVKS
jgi:hypothetical protein